MMTRYIGPALLATWLGAGGPALADGYHPTPYGAARLPEPVPCPTPDLVPGPLSPMIAPVGPGPEFALPAGHSGAFQCENVAPSCHLYFHAGTQALIRQDRLGRGGLSVIDPGPGLDTGFAPPRGAASDVRFKDIPQDYMFGYKGTLGLLYDEHQAFELTGFYIHDNFTIFNRRRVGGIDAFFFNPPVGFDGDANLFLQADRLQAKSTQRNWSLELNYRYTSAAFKDFELILGARYYDLKESIEVFVGDDDLIFTDETGRPDPVRQAFYDVQVHNRIVGPQVGVEWYHQWLKYVHTGIEAKALWGVNFVENDYLLIRGDGFRGFEARRTDTTFSHLYDIDLYIDFRIMEKATVRIGWTALWLLQINTAVDNFDFNLANPTGRKNDNGSIFYHGPFAEMQFLF